MAENFITNDFLRVLQALKNNILTDCNVAEIAIVESENSDNTYTCKILSTQSNVVTIKLNHVSVKSGDIVLILFNNTNFKGNLAKAINDQPTAVVNDKLHLKSYGIIIGTIKD